MRDALLKEALTETSIFAFVATTRFLLLVNLNTKEVIPLEFHRPEYYGVSWFPGGQELVLSHSMIDCSELKDMVTYVMSEVGLLSAGDFQTAPFLSAPHQILCGSDGRVICTNTGRNAITVVDLAKPNHIHETRISPARWDRLSLDHTCGDHLNSVFEKKGLLYVIAHGHSKGSTLTKLSYPDLQILDLQPIKHRTGLHNIWVTEDNRQISCHSEAGSLIEIHGNNSSKLWSAGGPVYTRGLAASAKFVLVGESQKLGRDLRHGSMSGLWLLDRSNWQPLDYFCLGPYGAVHEVRLINIPDEAHHGHLFDGLEKLLKCNPQKALSAQKLQASLDIRKAENDWSTFDLIYGSPTFGANSSLIAGTENLCLMTQPASIGQSQWSMAFRYSLDSSGEGSHVSVVTYRGHGGDTDMHALLIKSAGESEANLHLWAHDGNTWKVQPGIKIDGLPRTGDIHIQVSPAGLELRIDQKQISLDFQENIPWLDNGALGIRWIESTLYPLA